MIVASCPTRISLGSADHSPFAENYGGIALNICIDKRIYVIIRTRTGLENHKYRISYSKTELSNNLDDIKHPLVREAIRLLKVTDPLEIIYTADVPARLGLATSSSMVLALLKGLHCYKGESVSNEVLAREAYNLERIILNEAGGFQDQYCCFGGINYLQGDPRDVTRAELVIYPEQAKYFEKHLMLIYTGKQQSSSSVLEEQLTRLKKEETLEETLRIKQLVQEMYAIIATPGFNPLDLAPSMREAWEMKKKLSSSMVDENVRFIEQKILEVSPDAGYRLVGSGGGRGFILVMAPPDDLYRIGYEVRPLETTRFHFDWEGSTVYSVNHFCRGRCSDEGN